MQALCVSEGVPGCHKWAHACLQPIIFPVLEPMGINFYLCFVLSESSRCFLRLGCWGRGGGHFSRALGSVSWVLYRDVVTTTQTRSCLNLRQAWLCQQNFTAKGSVASPCLARTMFWSQVKPGCACTHCDGVGDTPHPLQVLVWA